MTEPTVSVPRSVVQAMREEYNDLLAESLLRNIFEGTKLSRLPDYYRGKRDELQALLDAGAGESKGIQCYPCWKCGVLTTSKPPMGCYHHGAAPQLGKDQP